MGRAKRKPSVKEAADQLFDLIESVEASLPAEERAKRWERFMTATDAVAERYEKRQARRQKPVSRAASRGR